MNAARVLSLWHPREVEEAQATRPKTRGDCIDAPRPCPWVGCRHHLYLDVLRAGEVRVSDPRLRDLDVADALELMPATCALDVARDKPDGVTLDVAGRILGCTRERVRQIEGTALLKLRGLSRRSVPGGDTQEPAALPGVRVATVLRAVADYYGRTVREILATRRYRSIARARAVAMYLARHHTGESYHALARAFGNRHHSSVVEAVGKIERRMAEDPALRSDVTAIDRELLRGVRQ